MQFKYILKRSKGRYLRIQIKPGGVMEIFKPRLMPMFLVERFLRKKQDWIMEKIEKQKKHPQPLFEKEGRRASKKQQRVKYLENKEEARKLVLEKLEYWKEYYKENFGIVFKWNKLAIKNSKTRWGSCSSRKNLNFSHKILHLPPISQDYLIVHELCHLIHMNHAKPFWDMLSLAISDYKVVRKSLKNINLG